MRRRCSRSTTTCYTPPTVDGLLVRDDGTVIAHMADDGDVGSPTWATSRDGGATWAALTDEPAGTPSDATEACAPSAGCFRVKPEVLEQRDGTAEPWRPAFAFTAEERRRMDLRTACGEATDFTLLAIVERADGAHVVVAVEGQGVLHRPPDGQWERREVLGAEPISVAGPSWFRWLPLAWLVTIVAAAVVLRLARPRRWRAGITLAIAGGAGLFFLFGASFFLGVDYVISGLAIVVLAVVLFVASMVVAWRPGKSLPVLADRPPR